MKGTVTYNELIGQGAPFNLPFTDKDLDLKIRSSYDHIIVLDDDPTGTQTVHDIPVLTEWSTSAISTEIERGTALFYILTNSRSLTVKSAQSLSATIAENIKYTIVKKGIKCLIISRSDSTLRGHYPLEVNELINIFNPPKAVHFIVPAFFEGGRLTKHNIHYVREGDLMIPAGETTFAKDKVFGFQNSNLVEWAIEKSEGNINKQQIHSLSIDEIENSSLKEITSKIDTFHANDICIINATEYNHLKMALYGILSSKVDPFFRSAASMVAALALQKPKILETNTLELKSSKGGLTVLGSYVPKSTDQLAHLLENYDIVPIEIDVKSLLENNQPDVDVLSKKIDLILSKNIDVILYTSRQLISAEESIKNLGIGSRISQYLTDIVEALTVTPRYVIGKGGITSSDVATRGLNMKRAIILGQMIPGVPVWQTLADSKFPYIPYIVFPGNVGDHTALTQVIQKLKEQ